MSDQITETCETCIKMSDDSYVYIPGDESVTLEGVFIKSELEHIITHLKGESK